VRCTIAYVQRQLGHASIQLTVDTYGKWLPIGNKAAVDRLDAPGADPSGSNVVATAGLSGGRGSDVLDNVGAGERNRTSNLRFTN
jgi:hypothetical protein